MSIKIYQTIYSKLLTDIKKLIDTYYDKDYGYYYDKFKEIEKDNKLYIGGYIYYPLSKNINSTDYISMYHVKNILRCVHEIPFVFIKMKTHKSKNCIGSYGGKHIIERYRDKINKNGDYYISNGEFIIAMLYCNFISKHTSNNINCIFNAIEI